MSARDFSKVSPSVWRSPRFLALSDRGKVAYLYFITNPHVPSSGIYFLPEGYACSDLQLSLDDYRQCRSETIAAELIDYDDASSVVLVERWFRHNPPANKDHATGTLRRIQEVECDRLREKALSGFNEANDALLAKLAEKEAQKASRVAQSHALIGGATTRLTSTRFFGRGDG